MLTDWFGEAKEMGKKKQFPRNNKILMISLFVSESTSQFVTITQNEYPG